MGSNSHLLSQEPILCHPPEIRGMGGSGEFSKGYVSQVLTGNENPLTENNSGLWVT